jgi:hypothetical protein
MKVCVLQNITVIARRMNFLIDFILRKKQMGKISIFNLFQ